MIKHVKNHRRKQESSFTCQNRISPWLIFVLACSLCACSQGHEKQKVFLVSNISYSLSRDVKDSQGQNPEEDRMLLLISNLNAKLSQDGNDLVIFNGGIVSSVSSWEADLSSFLSNYSGKIRGKCHFIPGPDDTDSFLSWEKITKESSSQLIEANHFSLILSKASEEDGKIVSDEDFVSKAIENGAATSKFLIPISPWWYGDDFIKNNVFSWSKNERLMMFCNGLSQYFDYNSFYCNALTDQGRVVPIVSPGNFSYSFENSPSVDENFCWGFCELVPEENALKMTHYISRGSYQYLKGLFTVDNEKSFSLELPVFKKTSWFFWVTLSCLLILFCSLPIILRRRKCFAKSE